MISIGWRLVVCGLAVFACLSALALVPSFEWKEVISKEGGFRILFPTEPKYSKKEMDTGAGRLVNQSYVLEEGPITFVIAWWDFPPEYVRRTGSVRILDGAKEAFFKRFKGKFLKERIIELGAAKGRDSVYETEDEIRLRLKLYLRGNRLVQALVTSEPDLIEGADANKFFESLKWE
jgi:hypothetical protein